MCQKQDSGGSDDAAELGIGKVYDRLLMALKERTMHIKLLFFFPLLDNVGGVFLVLGFGILFALVVAILEFMWNVKKVAVEQKV